jgi:hypothetical protein
MKIKALSQQNCDLQDNGYAYAQVVLAGQIGGTFIMLLTLEVGY